MSVVGVKRLKGALTDLFIVSGEGRLSKHSIKGGVERTGVADQHEIGAGRLRKCREDRVDI